MDFETSQMPKTTLTENASFGDGGGALGGDEAVAETGQQRGSRPPPPFLVKTFEVVDDPKTNSIISWNSNGTSFIIWDHIKFSAEILPTLFRTSNLSSFIYQLNYYRFRKVSWERYEYHNELFQAGKKHLLKDIKRRNQQPQLTKTKRARFTTKDDVVDDAMKTKLEAMMNEQNEVKLKIQKLGETLENMKEQFMHYVNDSKRARFDGSSSSTGLTVELQEKDSKEKAAESCGFWKKVMESVGGGGEGVLAPHRIEAVLELEEEMMASDVAMPCDLNVEDYGLLQLWS